jgi:dephospho-CoA kinase
MRLYGLTGGIGAGKSTVADLLEELGFPVVRADVIGREVVAPDEPGLALLVEAFGRQLLGPSGELDRRRLAALVFADPRERARLDAILHPLIHARSTALFRQLAAAGASEAVYESALLFETGRDQEMTSVIAVTAPRALRIARTCARSAFSPREVEQRMAAQWPDEEKAARARHVIANDGSREELRARVTALAREIRAELAPLPPAPQE